LTQLLDWTHQVSQIADEGLQQSRTATATERAALAQVLDVLSCDDVKAVYRVGHLGRGRYRVSGDVSARFTQRCVVTLESVAKELEETFDVEFWPAEAVPETTDTEIEVLTAAEIEPIEHGLIDAGGIIVETLSAGLDPYPRKPNAEFAWEEKDAEPSITGPFAGLSKLKDRR
jgi:uncharacterized metal-binding protein YceD (DUF177 family)